MIPHLDEVHQVAAHLLDVSLLHQSLVDDPDDRESAAVRDLKPRPSPARGNRGIPHFPAGLAAAERPAGWR